MRTLAKALDVRIGGNVVSFFDHVEASRVPELVDAISAGATVLVVSDAGMPLINDPGHRLVAACLDAGFAGAVSTRPVGGDDRAGGLRAAVGQVLLRGIRAAQAVGGKGWLASLAEERRMMVFFESPRRLPACLRDAVEQLGAGRRAAVCQS